jgi:hypothetical protein
MISEMAYGSFSDGGGGGGGGMDFVFDFLNSCELQPPFKF